MESFCNICKKEVCNKYFLKSHLLNKHGVQLEDYLAATANGVLSHSSFSGKNNKALAAQNAALFTAARKTGYQTETFEQEEEVL